MQRTYSRRESTQVRKNKRKAYTLLLASIVLFVGFVYYGLPLITRASTFFLDLKSSSTPIEEGDTTPPPPPHIQENLSYTNKNKYTIEGSSEPGATIIVYFDNEEYESLVNKEGQFTREIELSKGSNMFSVQAVDESGNKSQKTKDYEIVYDNEAPTLDSLNPASGSTFYSSSQKNLQLQGKTEPNTKVTVNGRFSVVNDEGEFMFQTSLSDGENKFNLIIEDQAGNKLEQELVYTYNP